MSVRSMRQSTFESIFSVVYWALSINVLLAIACVPILAVLIAVPEPWQVWPLVAVMSVCCGPALTAAFYCFDRYQCDGDIAVWRDFVRGYRLTFWRGLGIWSAAVAVVTIAIVDVVFLAQFSFAWLIVPPLATVVIVVGLLTPTALALSVMRTDATAVVCVKAGFASSLRSLWMAVIDLILLVVLAAVVVLKPAIGIALAPSVVLFLVWVNAQYVTRRVAGPRPGLHMTPLSRGER